MTTLSQAKETMKKCFGNSKERLTVKQIVRWMEDNSDKDINSLGFGFWFGCQTGRISLYASADSAIFRASGANGKTSKLYLNNAELSAALAKSFANLKAGGNFSPEAVWREVANQLKNF